MSKKTEDLHSKKQCDPAKEDCLPRSLYAHEKDPRGNLREKVDDIFPDKFMIFLSIILIPILLLQFILMSLNASFLGMSEFEYNQVLGFFSICDDIILILFIVEYTSKLYLAQNRWKHFKSPWHIVDLIIVVLAFVLFIPLPGLSTKSSWSPLLRLLRLPRALAVGGRAVAGRRNNVSISSEMEETPATVIRQVGPDLKTTLNLSWDELEAHVSDLSKQEWLDIHNVSEEGFTKLSRILQIAEPHFKSGLMDDIYPHIDYIKKSSFIFLQSGVLQFPEQTGNYLTISRSGVIVVCNGKKIITLSRHSVGLDEVLENVSQTRKDGGFVVPVLYGILERMLNDYKDVLSEIEIETLKIGNTPRSKLPKDFLERIYQLDKEVSRLVSNLVHFKDMLGIIISKNVPLEGFDKNAEEAFQVLMGSAVYLNEISRDLIDNLKSIIELYINQTSFETNKIIKILAVVTSVSVIPSAVGGLIGMNLIDVPFGAYLWQVCFVIGVAMTLAVYTFYKLGWLKT